jgi:ABC-2 type transport system ATP-binding protein
MAAEALDVRVPLFAVRRATDSPVALRVEGLCKRYAGGTLANDGIDLVVSRGETMGLLGRNGAGKTTLVRQITGELRPTSGSIHVMDVDVVNDHTRARALMGVVPQDAEPFDHLRPREHLAFFGRLRGLTRKAAARRADELMASLGLGQHERHVARQLSGGLKRKLLMGIALAGDPPVLVLDEPTTGLDPHSRREVWEILRDVHSRGHTIIITTHYMEEAEALCDQVALISNGRIHTQGTVDELRSRCRNRFRATYDGAEGRVVVQGETSEEVLAELARRGIETFALAKASLEDVYLELTDEALEA